MLKGFCSFSYPCEDKTIEQEILHFKLILLYIRNKESISDIDKPSRYSSISWIWFNTWSNLNKISFLKIYIFKFSPPQLSWDERSISPRICNFWCNFVSRLRTLYPLVTFNANFNGFTKKKLYVTICLYAEKSSSIGLTQITN